MSAWGIEVPILHAVRRTVQPTMLVIVGCTQESSEVSFEDIARACPIHAGDATPTVNLDGGLDQVSLLCADRVGRAFNFSWESFGESPTEFDDAITPAQVTIEGILSIGNLAGFTLDDVGSEPPTLVQELLREQEEQLAPLETDDISRLWLQFVMEAIKRVEYQPWMTATMAYQADTLFVGDVTGTYDLPGRLGGTQLLPLHAAAVVVHEAVHSRTGAHQPCLYDSDLGNSCDNTTEGPYGAAVWWLASWGGVNGLQLDPNYCRAYNASVLGDCAMINDTSGLAACAYPAFPCAES